jgi:hypothetical protein
LALLWLNVYIARELFAIEFTRHMGANEGTFMAIARMWLAHPGDMLWWPYWDAGMPLQNTYFPLVPLATALLAKVAGWSTAHSLHAWAAAAYCLGPVTLFAMMWKISRAPGVSFAAAVAYSLVSPSIVFGRILTDLGDARAARRLQVLVAYGEVPHIVSLAILPLAMLFLYFVFQGRRNYALAAGITSGLVALANAFGGITLAIAAVCMVAAMESGVAWRNVGRLALIGALTYVWISPAIPPSLIATILRNSPTTDGDFRATPWSLAATVLLPLAVLAVRGALFRWRWPFEARFASLLAIALGGIIWLGVQFGVAITAQPHRYHPSFEMAVCVAGTFGAWALLANRSRLLKAAVVALLLGAAVAQTIHYRRYAKTLIQPVEIEKRIEYRVAKWFAGHMPGARVMAPGSIALWLNVFSDNPDVTGGHQPSTPNEMQRVAVFLIHSGMNAGAADGELSAKWLKLFGAQAVAVSGPASQEVYHAIANANKFEGLLPLLWREGDDAIYAVPQRAKSLVYVIPSSAVVRRRPIHGLDVAPLEAHLAAMDDPAMPAPEVVWESRRRARIRAPMEPERVLAVQINYHPGWRASVNGRDVRVSSDQAGLMVVEPQCRGECDVRLEFDGGWELRLTAAASILLMAGVFWKLARS